MKRQMHVIVVGNGMYEYWPELKFVRPQNEQFIQYVKEQWPGARVTCEGAGGAWSASDIRDKLEGWLASCGKEDDLLLLWSGHGYGENTQHRLITYSSPAAGRGSLSSANTIRTQELADYLIKCPARRVVLLLNTCWSGDGGQELATAIGEGIADSLSAEQTRSMAIISSARREESVDGAFLSSILKVMQSTRPPIGLGQEHVWAASDRYLSPERLCAAVNVLLESSNHQAQLFTVYGVVGGFFRRANRRSRIAELPPGVVDRLRRDFPRQLLADPGPWTAAYLRDAVGRNAASEETGELAYRLSRLAVGLAALQFLESWLGADAGLANHLGPAWRSVLPPLHRIPHPVERFGYVEQVVLHGALDQVIEFVARVIQDAGDDPCQDRLYQWAERDLGVDRKVVDDALSRLDSRQVQSRLIINFGMAIAADGEEDAVPESVFAWLYRPGELCRETFECSFGPEGDVAEVVAELVAWARARAANISHVDVALPVSLFLSSSRPEKARIKLRGALTRPVAAFGGIAIRWADRITDPELRAEGLRQGNIIAKRPDALCLVDCDAYEGPQQLNEDLTTPARAVAFMRKPGDPIWLYAAAYNSPYVLWPEDNAKDMPEIWEDILSRWQELPAG